MKRWQWLNKKNGCGKIKLNDLNLKEKAGRETICLFTLKFDYNFLIR